MEKIKQIKSEFIKESEDASEMIFNDLFRIAEKKLSDINIKNQDDKKSILKNLDRFNLQIKYLIDKTISGWGY